MKLMDLAGLMNMSATNSLLSMIAAVLFVSSQITLKSKIPRFACTSRRNGSTIFTKLVIKTVVMPHC